MSVLRMIDGKQVTLRDRWYHGTTKERMAWFGAKEWRPHAGMMLTNTIEAGVHYSAGWTPLFITVKVPDYLLWSPERLDISGADLAFDRGNVIAMRSTVATDDPAIIISDGVPDAPNALCLVVLSDEAAKDIEVISIETLASE